VTLIPAHGQIFLALVLEAMELYHRDQIDALERVLGDLTYKFVEVDKASVVVVVVAVVAAAAVVVDVDGAVAAAVGTVLGTWFLVTSVSYAADVVEGVLEFH